MFLRAVKLSSFGGLVSSAFISKTKQESCNVKLDTADNVRGSCNVKLETINDIGRPEFSGLNVMETAGPEYSDLNCSDKSEKQDCDNETKTEEATEKVDFTADFELSEAEVIRPNEQGRQQAQAEKLKAAIAKARDLCWCKMYESGTPGMIVAISVNGKQVWQHGFGYSDLENKLLAGTGCVMRIASISKPLTMAVLAKLWEEGKVDLDSPVTKYVPDWPKKLVGEKEVDITLRQLCCHMSGVRHYMRKREDEETEEFDMKEYFLKETFATTDESIELFKDDKLLSAPGEKFNYTTHGFTLLAKVIENVTGQPFDKYMEDQFASLGLHNTYLDQASPIIYNRSKYYIRDKHHRLRNAPYVDNSYKWAGGGFLSNVGDLVKFGNAMLYSYQQKNGVSVQTRPPAPPTTPPPAKLPDVVPESPQAKTEEAQPEIPKSPETPLPKIEEIPPEDPDNPETEDLKSNPKTKNIDYLATLTDVVYQPGPYANVNKSPTPPIRYLPGYLKSSTMAELWRPQAGANLKWGGDDLVYGLGWAVRQRKKNYGFCLDQQHYVTHTGGAIGASSVLLVAPQPPQEGSRLPQGVVVAILCNMQGIGGLNKLAAEIGKAFHGFDQEKPVKVQKVYQC
eukprot:GFUD01037486.1.p1 GENE.GFUD01037486.1~~GFUD01037486.1.p1  ORF type:complete len:623 (+),score=230.90 GFUD01037486.1:36-1904(+)